MCLVIQWSGEGRGEGGAETPESEEGKWGGGVAAYSAPCRFSSSFLLCMQA